MTSSFKRPRHACLSLHLDSLSSHLKLLTGLCTRLVTSNLSATAIFQPPPPPHFFLERLLMLDFIRQPFPACSGGFQTENSQLLCVGFGSRWHYWSLAPHADANSCWWPFPFSFLVTWLCQSKRLTRGGREVLADRKTPLLQQTFFLPWLHKLEEDA